MNRDEVVALMESATSERDWNNKADQVKAACGGYPGFWWDAIMLSGLANRVLGRFGSDANIRIIPMHRDN